MKYVLFEVAWRFGNNIASGIFAARAKALGARDAGCASATGGTVQTLRRRAAGQSIATAWRVRKDIQRACFVPSRPVEKPCASRGKAVALPNDTRAVILLALGRGKACKCFATGSVSLNSDSKVRGATL